MRRRTFLIGASTSLAGAAAWVALRNRLSSQSVNYRLLESLGTADRQEYDYCVIGSGPAGCTVAQRLVENDFKVAMLESGVNLDDADKLQRTMALDTYSNSGQIDYPIKSSRLRAIGGTSNIWTGRCPRMLPTDFVDNPLAPGGRWPIRYEDLQPFYRLAEQDLFVSGATLSESHAPRSEPLPYRLDDRLGELRDLLSPLDIVVDAPPQSRNPETHQPLRYSSHVLPGVAARRNIDVFGDATVTRLKTDDSGTITAAEVRSTGGHRAMLRAKRYVIACGALESTRLLLLSGGSLADRSNLLGRNFMEHPFVSFEATLPDDNRFSHSQLGRTYQYSSELNTLGLGKSVVGIYGYKPNKIRVGIGIEMSPEASNRLSLSDIRDPFGNPGLNLNLSFSDRDAESFRLGEQRVLELLSRLNARNVEKRKELHWSHHHMGTTRMGTSPEVGVVDKNLKVFGSSNLYVASSSVFVTSGAANPTLTIVALAHRLAQHLLNTT